MQIGRIEFGARRIEVHIIHHMKFDNVPKHIAFEHISLEDLAKMFGLNTDVSDIPPVADISTLHRRNATAIKRSLELCN